MPAYFDTRHKQWFVKFYYRNYRGEPKQKKKTGFLTKREALSWERDFKTKDQIDSDTSYCDIYKLFLAENASTYKRTTIRTYEIHLENNIRPFFKDMPFSHIDKKVYLAWRKWLLARGKSMSYVKKAETEFRTIYAYGLSELEIKYNFTKGIKKMKDNSPRKKMNFWTYDEFARFINKIDDHELFFIFHLFYNSGMRLGELLALTGNDFKVEDKSINISKSLQRENGKNIITTPKSQKSCRVIAMPDYIFDVFRAHIKNIYRYNPDDLLFTMSKHKLHDAMHKYAALAGVKPIRIHDLRHSHASYLINNNFNPLVVSERLGHERVSVTLDIYGHMYAAKDQSVGDYLNQAHDAQNKKEDSK